MLVLRRRPLESILFDGGVKLTVVALSDHRAWISLAAPCLEREVVLSVTSVSPEAACLGVRGPVSVRHDGSTLHLVVDGRDDTVLLVNRRVGEEVRFPGLMVGVSALEGERALLSFELASLSGVVGISVFPVAGAEVKIGIEAPEHVRVFRQEVWEELEAANAGASAQWSESDLASLSAAQRRR